MAVVVSYELYRRGSGCRDIDYTFIFIASGSVDRIASAVTGRAVVFVSAPLISANFATRKVHEKQLEGSGAVL
jgi:hypothetical protein